MTIGKPKRIVLLGMMTKMPVEINADYPRHSRAASEVAREYFNYDVVLARLLGDVGV